MLRWQIKSILECLDSFAHLKKKPIVVKHLKSLQINEDFFSKNQITKAEYTMTDANIETQYQFRVKVENAAAISEPSDVSDAVTIYGKAQHVCAICSFPVSIIPSLYD